jgi:LysM repeat protein
MVHGFPMRVIFWIFPTLALVLALTGCGTSGTGGGGSSTQRAGTGPFDSRGNYVEEWADNPSKWRKPGSYTQPTTQTKSLSQITKVDQPPMHSVPLVTQKPQAAVATIAATQAVSELPKVEDPRPTVVKKAVKPERESERPKAEKEPTKPKPERESERPKTKVITKTKSSSHQEAKSKPKTKAKVIAKPKPKSTRYTVRRGDSLSAIANRTGASVSSIKRANGISGNVIRPGQSLSIPK